MTDGTDSPEEWLADDERWTSIPSCPEFEASELGRIRGTDRTVTYSDGRQYFYPAKLRKQHLDDKGYLRITLRQADGRNRTRLVHHLILEAFVGPCPAGQEGCHWDGDPTNNHLSNLRWDTHSANQRDTVRYGNNPQRRKTHCPRGHELREPNLTPTPASRGLRVCLVCTKVTNRARYLSAVGAPVDADALLQHFWAVVFAPETVEAGTCRGADKHPRTPENREIVGGKDRCKPCNRGASKRHHDRKRAEPRESA